MTKIVTLEQNQLLLCTTVPTPSARGTLFSITIIMACLQPFQHTLLMKHVPAFHTTNAL